MCSILADLRVSEDWRRYSQQGILHTLFRVSCQIAMCSIARTIITTDAHLDLAGASSNSYYVGSISVAERSVVVYPMNLVCAAQPVVSVLCHQVGAARILAPKSRG